MVVLTCPMRSQRARGLCVEHERHAPGKIGSIVEITSCVEISIYHDGNGPVRLGLSCIDTNSLRYNLYLYSATMRQ
jgi:hypothetical protein